MIDLTGKIVLVTGASRGIGASIANVLGRAGAAVALHYSSNKELAEKVAGEPGMADCELFQADLSIKGAGLDLWRQAVSWRGHIDVLVNNAGIMPPGGVDHDEAQWADAWEQTLQVNLIAAADLCREGILHFRERDGGIIINIASRAAFRGDAPDHFHYAASKGGMISMTKTIARGFAADGILAYSVAPGFVSTDMANDFIAVHGDEQIVRDIPMGAIAPPEEVANIVAFLASGLASHATGSTIDINGASYVR